MRRGFKVQELFSTEDVARLLGVDYTTVIVWCEKEKLKSSKTPGGHRRIHYSDLLDFLQACNLPIPAALKSIGKLNCVIVDDDPDIRKIVKQVLKKIDSQANIEEAEDGFSAGQKVTEMIPNLVILDLHLPGLNGFAVCEKIRKNNNLKKTKILAISGQGTPENKNRILQAGANEFLPKPFEASVLKDAITKLIK